MNRFTLIVCFSLTMGSVSEKVSIIQSMMYIVDRLVISSFFRAQQSGERLLYVLIENIRHNDRTIRFLLRQRDVKSSWSFPLISILPCHLACQFLPLIFLAEKSCWWLTGTSKTFTNRKRLNIIRLHCNDALRVKRIQKSFPLWHALLSFIIGMKIVKY